MTCWRKFGPTSYLRCAFMCDIYLGVKSGVMFFSNIDPEWSYINLHEVNEVWMSPSNNCFYIMCSGVIEEEFQECSIVGQRARSHRMWILIIQSPNSFVRTWYTKATNCWCCRVEIAAPDMKYYDNDLNDGAILIGFLNIKAHLPLYFSSIELNRNFATSEALLVASSMQESSIICFISALTSTTAPTSTFFN
jgi:hypothetical protein